jgi:hypothetical protein
MQAKRTTATGLRRNFKLIEENETSAYSESLLRKVPKEVASNLMRKYTEVLGGSPLPNRHYNIVHSAVQGGMVALGEKEPTIQPSEVVGVYLGTICPDDEDTRNSDCCFSLDQIKGMENMVVDAQHHGSPLKYMQQDCDPNCSIQVLLSDKKTIQLVVVAERLIEPGDLLTIHYRWPVSKKGAEGTMNCLCGSAKCSKYYLTRERAKPTKQSLITAALIRMPQGVRATLTAYNSLSWSEDVKNALLFIAECPNTLAALKNFMQSEHAVDSLILSASVKYIWGAEAAIATTTSKAVGNKRDRNALGHSQHDNPNSYKKCKYRYDKLLEVCELSQRTQQGDSTHKQHHSRTEAQHHSITSTQQHRTTGEL